MLSRRSCDHQHAVTLTEVLLLAAVTVTLTFALALLLSGARESARRKVCAANLNRIAADTFTFAMQHEGKGPPVMRRVGTTAPRTLFARNGQYLNLGLLVDSGTSPGPQRFYCPSQRRFSFGITQDALRRGTACCSYAYAVHVPDGGSPRLDAGRHTALATDDFVALLGTKAGVGRYAHRVGYNVLHQDGSTAWYADPDEKIWQQAVQWDDEKDNVTYETLYGRGFVMPDEAYGNGLDIFRVWHALGRNRPDPF